MTTRLGTIRPTLPWWSGSGLAQVPLLLACEAVAEAGWVA